MSNFYDLEDELGGIEYMPPAPTGPITPWPKAPAHYPNFMPETPTGKIHLSLPEQRRMTMNKYIQELLDTVRHCLARCNHDNKMLNHVANIRQLTQQIETIDAQMKTSYGGRKKRTRRVRKKAAKKN